MRKLFFYSDGASKNNGKKDPNIEVLGSFASLIVNENNKILIKDSNSFENVTNNQMELFGFIKAAYNFFLRYQGGEEYEINVISDSQYLIKGVNEWMNGWKRKGWKNVKNLCMWLLIDDILNFNNKIKFKFEWVKGHSGKTVDLNTNNYIYFNEQCDSLAVNSIKNQSTLKDFNNELNKINKFFERR